MRTPVIFVINLDQDTDRLRTVDRELTRLGARYERMPAVHGKQLSEKQWSKATTPLCRMFCTPTIVGCFRSHYNCWRAVVERGLNHAVILEDDVTLEDDFLKQINTVIKANRDDWDVVLLGCFLCKRGKPVDEQFYKPYFWAGTHAYLISARGAKKLCSEHGRASFHVDMVMNMDPQLDILALRKQVAYQSTVGTGSHNQSGNWSLFDRFRIDEGRVGLGFVLGTSHARIMGYDVTLGNFLLMSLLVMTVVILKKRVRGLLGA